MDREEMRRLDEYRFSQAGPLENDLVDELAEGGMDRQEFIRRATVLGLSVGVIGSALAAYDTPLAFGAPIGRQGGRPPPARHHPAPGIGARSPHLQGSGRPHDRRHRRRVPHPCDADA